MKRQIVVLMLLFMGMTSSLAKAELVTLPDPEGELGLVFQTLFEEFAQVFIDYKVGFRIRAHALRESQEFLNSKLVEPESDFLNAFLRTKRSALSRSTHSPQEYIQFLDVREKLTSRELARMFAQNVYRTQFYYSVADRQCHVLRTNAPCTAEQKHFLHTFDSAINVRFYQSDFLADDQYLSLFPHMRDIVAKFVP